MFDDNNTTPTAEQKAQSFSPFNARNRFDHFDTEDNGGDDE